MAKKLRCWVCGEMHDYCPTCGQTHGWKYVADTYEHYQIYMIKEEVKSGTFSKKEAVEKLAELGVKAENNLSWMRPHMEKAIREIIGDKEKESIKTTKKSKLFKDE